jgi:rhodanese-related sulfurtransferase
MIEPAPEITCREVAQKRSKGEQFVLLDCRELQEYELASIDGAQLIPMGQLAERKQELAGNEDKLLVVYCHHGVRSAQTANWLRQQGFASAVSMAGGIDAWALEIEPDMQRY